MRYFILGLGFLLLACGGTVADGYTATVCDIPCFGRVAVDFEADCQKVARNFELARALVLELPLKAVGSSEKAVSAEHFCPWYSELDVGVSQDMRWRMWTGEMVPGEYSLYDGVKLNPTMESLVHEMLHHADYKNGRLDSWRHPQWEERRFREASLGYKAANLDDLRP